MGSQYVRGYTAPMTNFDRIASFYQSYIEQISISVDSIVSATSEAADAATTAIFEERKLIVCGLGVDSAPATLLSELLRNGLRADRPALPTIELISRFATPREGSVNWLTQQLTVLGQPQDMAIVFASELDPADVDLIFNAINKRSMNIFWIGAAGPHGHLCFDRCDPKVSLSLYHSAAICLADLIEVAMFGPMEEYP